MSGVVSSVSEMADYNFPNISNAKSYTFKHHTQTSNWDCGLACVLMVLPRKYRDNLQVENNLQNLIDSEGFGSSTWTIDLCYLLKKFDISFYYTTITIGVDPDFIKESFYESVISIDAHRVEDRFRTAESNSICIKRRSVHLREILRHLDKFGPIIVLTNANLLKCMKCSSGWSFPSQSYQGHFILLIGYDIETKRISYRNPSFRDSICSLSFISFDKARKAHGTDEDVIFIYTENY